MSIRRIIIALLATTLLAGCVYHPNVQQGNVITTKDVRSLHRGMTASEVVAILDEPVLTNIYRDNRMVYVYTFRHRTEKMQETRLIIYFRNNKVVRFWTDKKMTNDKAGHSLPLRQIEIQLRGKVE